MAGVCSAGDKVPPNSSARSHAPARSGGSRVSSFSQATHPEKGQFLRKKRARKRQGRKYRQKTCSMHHCPFSQASSTPKLQWQQLPDKTLGPDLQKKTPNNVFPKLHVFFAPSPLRSAALAILKPRGLFLGSAVTRVGPRVCCHASTGWPQHLQPLLLLKGHVFCLAEVASPATAQVLAITGRFLRQALPAQGEVGWLDQDQQ